MLTSSSYRPHDPGHDYYAPGIYLITLVVRNRLDNLHMFGCLGSDPREPRVELSEVGKAVLRCWEEIPERQAQHGRRLLVHAATCMPDHFHGVIEVKERMDVSLGEVICGFKIGCTQAWRQLEQPCTAEQLCTAAVDGKKPYMASNALVPDLHRMSKKQRAAYYAAHPEAQQPLWDDNYDDTICLSDPVTGAYCQRHFTAMVQYVSDNARRAIIMKLRPEFMQRCLHVRIASTTADGAPVVRDYAAFGNLFLLRWARKVQVFCHRLARRGMLTEDEWQKATASPDAVRRFEDHARAHKLGRFDRYWYRAASAASVTAIDYTRTEAYRQKHDAWVAQVMAGQTVVVTPGISRGEQLMKEECIARGYPLIHLQKEPIGACWKPEMSRFNACTRGSLLILAPWKPDELGAVGDVPSDTNYSVFHNMNRLAEEICLFDGEAVLINR